MWNWQVSKFDGRISSRALSSRRIVRSVLKVASAAGVRSIVKLASKGRNPLTFIVIGPTDRGQRRLLEAREDPLGHLGDIRAVGEPGRELLVEDASAVGGRHVTPVEVPPPSRF
ncbi:hypothetical protein [Streptomyces sp. LARHCF252]